jgi:alpha-beta hydrolase superfamily lysophospholipase
MKIIDFKVSEDKAVKMYVWDDVSLDQAKGVVQLVHGMAEHMGRYQNFAKFLNRNGYVVYGTDHRGHGLNVDMEHLGWDEGDMWSNDIEDQLRLTEYIKIRHPNLPIIVHGHSYGSFLTQMYMAYNKHAVAFALSGSNYIKGADISFGRFLSNWMYRRHGDFVRAKLMAKLTFGSYQNKMNGNGSWLTSNAEEFEKYQKDPRCGFICSTNFYKWFMKGVKGLYTKQYAADINKDIPIYIYAGDNDHVGKCGKGINKLYSYYKKLGVKDLSVKLYEGGRHEMLFESNKDEVAKDVLEYFDRIIAQI